MGACSLRGCTRSSKIKSVSKVFEKIATTEKFRLFANIELGSDVTVAQLEEKYDAVVIATGSALGKL